MVPRDEHPAKPAAWLTLGLLVTAWFAGLTMFRAFASPLTVQDDARQHVFWAYRYLDPELFPNDAIADYFQAIAPAGYRLLYWTAAQLGLDPILFNRILPLLLGLATTLFVFKLVMRLTPVPACAFTATLLLNLLLWGDDDLPSGTPRAFIYPLLAASLFYLLKRDVWRYLLSVVAAAMFYPAALFVSVGVLGLTLLRRDGWSVSLSREARDYGFVLAGVVVAVLGLLPFLLSTTDLGPVIGAAEARLLPEFQPGGRSCFFLADRWSFWLEGERSGLMPWALANVSSGLIVGLALVWPLLGRYRCDLGLAARTRDGRDFLAKIVVSSLILFFSAHLLLFELHLPNRYTQHSLRIVTAIAAAFSVVWLLSWGARLGHRARALSPMASGFYVLVVLVLGVSLAVPGVRTELIDSLIEGGYVCPPHPGLYEYLRTQPKGALTASLDREVDFIPVLARRPVLVSREHAIPYHVTYRTETQQRAADLFEAQYTSDPQRLRSFVKKYNVRFIMIEPRSYRRPQESWVGQYVETGAAAESVLSKGAAPALLAYLRPCTAWRSEGLHLIDAGCILESTRIAEARQAR